MIKAIIFDVGGVIVNPGTLRELRKRYAKMLNVPRPLFATYFYKGVYKWRVGKIDEKQFWSTLLSDLKIKADVAELRRIMYGYQDLNKSVVKIIKKLKPNYKLAIISNHLPEWFGHIRKIYKFDSLFDVIVTSFGAHVPKPSRKIYEITLKKLKRKPGEVVFIDNDIRNVVGAKLVGMNAILFKNVSQLKRDLKKFGVEA